MKKLLSAFVLLLLLSNSFAQADSSQVYMFSYFKGNGVDGLHLAYSYDGYNWQSLQHDSSFLVPTVGGDKLMRDPCIIRGPNNIFHMVWTVSWKERSIGYASSTDLIHWSVQKEVPVMMHEPNAQNCWAPEIYYDDKKEQFLIYWATTIKGRFPATDSMGDHNHRIYYVTTKDFSRFSKTKLLYNKDFNVIDATIQKLGDEYLMFLKDETLRPVQKNIKIARSRNLYKNYSIASAPVTGSYWAEGPTVIKINDKWIVYFDKYREHQYGAVQSTDLQHWEDISDKISFPKGTRHGTVFVISKNEFQRFFSR